MFDTTATGGASVQLCVAGLTGTLQLEGASPALWSQIRARLGDYASGSAAAFPPSVAELRVSFVRDRPRPPNPTGDFIRPLVRVTEQSLTIERWDFQASLQRSGQGLTWAGHASCLDTPFTFESLCRVLWSVLLPRMGAALFHGCGISLDGGRGAVLAAGPSGAGKTTLARKVPRASDVLSDEVVVVARSAEGWFLESTPFFGELAPTSLVPRRFPLVGLAFLEQLSRVTVSPLAAGDAAFRAIGCLMSWEQDDEGVRRLFDLVVALTSEVPTFRCASRADSPFAEILAAIAPLLAAGQGRS